MEDVHIITNKNGTTFRRKKRAIHYEKNIYVRLSTEDKQFYETIVKKQGTTMGEKTRELIKAFIKENI